jgi:hypothetical protein
MTVVAVLAGKGSPGVTTTAFALAAVWPRPAVFAECDPAGGDLPYLVAGSGTELSPARGAVSLAAAARLHTPVLDEHLQLVRGVLPVLVGPASRAQSTAMAAGWSSVVHALTDVTDRDVVVDCSAFGDAAVTGHLMAAAQATVLVCRATLPSVAHTRDVLVALGRRGDGSAAPATTVGVAVVGEPAEVREVEQALAAHSPSFVAGVAHDPGAAAGLFGAWNRKLDRSRLLLDVRALARLIDARCARPAGLLPASDQGQPMPAVAGAGG